MEHIGRLVHGHEPEEGSDRGQPRIAAAGAVAALAFDVDQEVAHQVGVQIFDLEFRRRPAGPLAGEAQQQAERVAIAGDRVRARLHLGAEPVGEELLDERRKR